MNIELLRQYCLEKSEVDEGFPFGETVLVFKVKGKMFLLLPLDTESLQFNVKCDPEKAIELRSIYPSVQPGFHMSKIHWNTVVVDGSIEDELIFEWIDHSYDLIVESVVKSKIKPKANTKPNLKTKKSTKPKIKPKSNAKKSTKPKIKPKSKTKSKTEPKPKKESKMKTKSKLK